MDLKLYIAFIEENVRSKQLHFIFRKEMMQNIGGFKFNV